MLVVVLEIGKLFGPKTSQDVANQFMNDTVSGKTSQAYTLTNPSFRKLTSSVKFTADIQFINKSCSGVANLKYSSISTSAADYMYDNNQVGGGICYLQVDLIHESSGWRVSYFNEY